MPSYVAALAEGLIGRGWRVSVLAPPENAAVPRLLACGADVYGVRLSEWPSPRDAAIVRRATRLCGQGVGVIHGHSTKASLLSAWVSRASRVPSVYSPHFWAFARPVHPAMQLAMASFERRMSRVHRQIVAVAECERSQARAVGIGTPVKVVRTGLPDGPPPISRENARAVLGIRAHVPLAAWVGRRSPQKRPQDLAPLALALSAAGVELVALGHGLPGSREGKSFVAAGGHLVDGVESHVLYAAADVFVQTSQWESTPLAVLEAMRAGLPVIAYDVGGIADLVCDGVTGYRVAVATLPDLAERIVSTTMSTSLRVTLGESGRRRYEAEFSFDQMIDSVAAAYDSLPPRCAL